MRQAAVRGGRGAHPGTTRCAGPEAMTPCVRRAASLCAPSGSPATIRSAGTVYPQQGRRIGETFIPHGPKNVAVVFSGQAVANAAAQAFPQGCPSPGPQSLRASHWSVFRSTHAPRRIWSCREVRGRKRLPALVKSREVRGQCDPSTVHTHHTCCSVCRCCVQGDMCAPGLATDDRPFRPAGIVDQGVDVCGAGLGVVSGRGLFGLAMTAQVEGNHGMSGRSQRFGYRLPEQCIRCQAMDEHEGAPTPLRRQRRKVWVDQLTQQLSAAGGWVLPRLMDITRGLPAPRES